MRINHTRTETFTATICTIDDERSLFEACRQVGSHYWSEGNRRFHRSKLLDLWTTVDGAIWVERTGAGFDRAGGSTHKCMQIIITETGHQMLTLYSGLQDGARGATSLRRAQAAARAVLHG